MKKFMPLFFSGSVCSWLILGLSIGMVGTPSAVTMKPEDTLTVKVEQKPLLYSTYAVVEPVQTLSIKASTEGTLQQLRLLPGAEVKAGEILARLGGSKLSAMQEYMRVQQKHAQTELDLRDKQMALTKLLLQAHRLTRADLLDAQLKQNNAANLLALARHQSRMLAIESIIYAPVSGTILNIQAANGQNLAAGSPILTLIPAGQLWLTATFYGSAAQEVRTGMTGVFTPAGSMDTWSVRVLSRLAKGMGVQVGMNALSSSKHRLQLEQGLAGRLVLQGGLQSVVQVPTRALVLDQGQWWVLIQTPQGEHAQAVQLGAVHGWWTEVTAGLSDGMHVVIRDAYLRYHHDIANNYQLPD